MKIRIQGFKIYFGNHQKMIQEHELHRPITDYKNFNLNGNTMLLVIVDTLIEVSDICFENH